MFFDHPLCVRWQPTQSMLSSRFFSIFSFFFPLARWQHKHTQHICQLVLIKGALFMMAWVTIQHDKEGTFGCHPFLSLLFFFSFSLLSPPQYSVLKELPLLRFFLFFLFFSSSSFRFHCHSEHTFNELWACIFCIFRKPVLRLCSWIIFSLSHRLSSKCIDFSRSIARSNGPQPIYITYTPNHTHVKRRTRNEV